MELFYVVLVGLALLLVRVVWRRIPRASIAVIRGSGKFNLEVVGESHYQPALRDAAGKGEVRRECVASLVLEPENPHDDQAVRVDVGDRTVGYLSRKDAREFRRLVQSHSVSRFQCAAVIVGGGRGRSLGIWLDVWTKTQQADVHMD